MAEDAFERLKDALAGAGSRQGNFNYPLLSELDPFLENIRSEGRFKRLMTDVKTRWEAFGKELESWKLKP